MQTTRDPPYIDFHEEFPSKAELRGQYMRCCAKCHEIKSSKSFRKILTRAQAEARGYKGDHTERPMNIESSTCGACRGEWLRPSQIKRASPVKLLDEVENGRLREQLYIMEMARRRKDPHRTLSARAMRGGLNRWHNFRQDRWVWAREQVAIELRHLTQRWFRLRGKEKTPRYAAVLAFDRLYEQTLQKLRAESNYFKLRAAPAEDSLTWETWVGVDEFTALWRAWGTLVAEHPSAGRPLRRPMVLDMAKPGVFERCPTQTRRDMDPELQTQITQFAEDEARGMHRIR